MLGFQKNEVEHVDSMMHRTISKLKIFSGGTSNK